MRETSQDFRTRTNQATSDICFNKEVWIEKTGEDRYDRTLGYVYVNGLCIIKKLLKQGMAWNYKYFNKDPELARLETEAGKAKVGIGSQPNFVAP